MRIAPSGSSESGRFLHGRLKFLVGRLELAPRALEVVFQRAVLGGR